MVFQYLHYSGMTLPCHLANRELVVYVSALAGYNAIREYGIVESKLVVDTSVDLDEALLSEAVARMVEVGDPIRIILFGSRARGSARPDSDYDFLVLEDSTLPRYRRAAKYRRALVGLLPSKDILVWTPSEAAEWSTVPQALVTTAINEGIVLYEREH
jgi:predicted nucleotidyltransferase